LSVPPARASIWATGTGLLLARYGTDLTNDRCIVDLASIAAPTNVMDVGDTFTFESRPLDRPRLMRTSSCGAERWRR
jgi:hypothetical protein